jgi:hypothetical protein
MNSFERWVAYVHQNGQTVTGPVRLTARQQRRYNKKWRKENWVEKVARGEVGLEDLVDLAQGYEGPEMKKMTLHRCVEWERT